jgi:hypothetical protein
LIRQLQQRLLVHQMDEIKKAQVVAANKAAKGQRLSGQNGALIAVSSQVVARRHELGKQPSYETATDEPKRQHVPAASVDKLSPRRAILTLQRA